MLPFPSVRARRVSLLSVFVAIFIGVSAHFAQPASPSPKAKSSSPLEVPLPIGHEAKGLVLPDYDIDGKKRVRFVAGTAQRTDQNHIEFHDLMVTTYVGNDQVDLEIAMADAILDLDTRVLQSQGRTTIKRADFDLVGDSARFDTAAKQSTITGNVKMIIKDSRTLAPSPSPR